MKYGDVAAWVAAHGRYIVLAIGACALLFLAGFLDSLTDRIRRLEDELDIYGIGGQKK